MSYDPKPIPTETIRLSDDMLLLTELLAKNAHDIWARQRILEGWTYGKKRNDEKKEHPCLVPYEDLPQNEKEYDRQAVLQTLKCILSLGFKINKHPLPEKLDKLNDS